MFSYPRLGTETLPPVDSMCNAADEPCPIYDSRVGYTNGTLQSVRGKPRNFVWDKLLGKVVHLYEVSQGTLSGINYWGEVAHLYEVSQGTLSGINYWGKVVHLYEVSQGTLSGINYWGKVAHLYEVSQGTLSGINYWGRLSLCTRYARELCLG